MARAFAKRSGARAGVSGFPFTSAPAPELVNASLDAGLSFGFGYGTLHPDPTCRGNR